MGQCISYKEDEVRPQFCRDRQVKHSETPTKSLRPLDTTLYNLLRKQSQIEIIHSSQEGHLFANSSLISHDSLTITQMKVLYNFKSILMIGKPDFVLKIAQEASLKELYMLSETDAKRFVKQYVIYDKKQDKPYKPSAIPILVFSQNELGSSGDGKQDNARTIYIHSQKHTNHKVYDELNIDKIIEPISKNDDLQKHIQHYNQQFKKIGKDYRSLLLLHEDNLKQPDIRAILAKHLRKAYDVTEKNADQYLRRFLPSDNLTISSKEDHMRATFYTERQVLPSRPTLAQSDKTKQQNILMTEKVLVENKEKEPDLAVSESLIKKQIPVHKIEGSEIIKPYLQVLKDLYKESSLETVERTYSVCVLLISNISNNPLQESYRQVKASNSKIYDILKYRNGKKLMEMLGWNQDKQNDGFFVNHVEAKYLKIFRVDLDLAYRLFQVGLNK